MTPTKIKILLASGSPRRRELLSELGLEFEICKPDVDESPLTVINNDGEIIHESPEALCERLARLKATAASTCVTGDSDILVIAADTIVVVDGHVLGKPVNRDDACAMLRMLQGRAHEVMTGVAISWQGKLISGVERTTVHFRPMSETEIQAYAATGECDDKAGAYAIQGRGALFITGIEGDYFNVVGLPLCRLGHMLNAVAPTVLTSVEAAALKSQ